MLCARGLWEHRRNLTNRGTPQIGQVWSHTPPPTRIGTARTAAVPSSASSARSTATSRTVCCPPEQHRGGWATTRGKSGPPLASQPGETRHSSTHRGDVRLLLHRHMFWGCTGCHTVQTPILNAWLLFVAGSGLLFAGQRVLVTARGGLIQRGRACRHGNLCTTHCTLKRGKGGPVVSSTEGCPRRG